MAERKQGTSIRLSPEAIELCAALGHKLGATRTGVLELAVRRLAQAEGIELPAAPGTKAGRIAGALSATRKATK